MRYCLNNPLIYTDPSGEFIFTLLAAVTGQWWALPITIGADFGAVTGGIRGANSNVGFWGGALRGAAVGAVGGGLSMIGGAGMPFASDLLLGTAEGAITGGLNAALWGNDIGQGMLWGAAGGAVFTTLTSENFGNWTKGEKFLTNERVFNNMMDRGMDKQRMLDYFGFEGKYIGGDGQSHFWFNKNDHSKFGIRYTDGAFDSYDALRNTNMKETFHMRRFARKGLKGFELGDSQVFSIANMPEERLGVIHQYKNQGFYRKDTYNYLKAIGNTESFIDSYNLGLYKTAYLYTSYSEKWWHFVYKIPRRW